MQSPTEQESFQAAIEMGLNLVQFNASEWVGLNGEGKHVEVVKFYWVRKNYFHSGPFVTLAQSLEFIHNYYCRHPEERSSEQGSGTSSGQRIPG